MGSLPSSWVMALALGLPAAAQEPSGARAGEIDEAGRQFVEWQLQMLLESRKHPPELAKILARKTVVPPLPPGPGKAEPPMTDLSIPVFPGRKVRLSVGEPDVTFRIGVAGKALNLVGASYAAGATYSCADDNVTFGGTAEVKGILFTDGKHDLAGGYQYLSTKWGQPRPADQEKPAGLQLGADFGTISGAVSYSTERQAGVNVGYDLISTPKPLSRIFEMKLGLELEITAPFEFKGWVKEEDGEIRPGDTRRVAAILAAPMKCPHCVARGELDCGRCSNRRIVTCPDCKGARQAPCGRCEGGGSLYCARCDNHSGQERCYGCSGSGALRCSGCGGGGQVTTYTTETRSRQVRVLKNAGFDANGQPFEEWGYENQDYTVTVPQSSSCGSCGGSGRGGGCGSCGGDGRVTCGGCGGDGIVPCGRCSGSGKVNCGECGGSGQVECPGCGGRPIVCPLCRGEKNLGGR